MSKVVGEVAIEVGADIGPLVREMTRAKGVLSGFGRAADKIGGGLDRFGSKATALGAKLSIVSGAIAAVTAGAFTLAKSGAAAGDAIGDAAKAAGMSTTAFQEYRYALEDAADMSGEEFASAAAKLNKTLGEAREGGTAAVKAFEAIGVSQEQLASSSFTADQAMAAFVAKMEATTDPATAAAMATDLFGKSGATLGAALSGVPGQVGALVERARELGVVMGPEAIDAAGKFDTKMKELGAQFEAVKMKIAKVLLPFIVDTLIPAFEKYVIPGINAVIDAIGNWADAFNSLPESTKAVVLAITAAFGTGGPILFAIGLVSTAIGAIFTGPAAPLVLLAAAITAGALAWARWGDDFKAAVGGAVEWVTGKFEAFLAMMDRIIQKARDVGTAIANSLTFQAGDGQIQNVAPGALDAPAPGGSGWVQGGAGGAMGGQMMGASIVNGMVLGATNAINEKREALAAVFAQVPQIARDVLGIHSPSTVFADIGNFMGQGMAQGITASSALVGDAVKGMTGAAVGAANDGVSGVLNAMGGLFEGSKKISAGIALANSWLAFTEVLKDPSFVGRPWARVAAAIAALKPGLQAVKNINAARPGGGGATGVGGGMASGAASAPQGIANITLVGDSFSRGTVESLFKQINDGQRMGYRINLLNP